MHKELVFVEYIDLNWFIFWVKTLVMPVVKLLV